MVDSTLSFVLRTLYFELYLKETLIIRPDMQSTKHKVQSTEIQA